MTLLGISIGYIEIAIVVITLSYIVYKYSTRNFDYWKKRGIPYVKPLPIIGNFLDVFMLRQTIGHHLAKYYNEFETPYFGMFVMNTPHLIVKDPNIIKSILVKDFNYFQDRNLISDEKCDSVSSKMLFIVKNPEWRHLRTKMSPVFTSGKIKSMLSLINAAADEMVIYISKNLGKNSLEAKELCAKYSTDVIASCAFGIDAHSFENEDAEFRVVGRKMFDAHWKTALRQTSYFLAPSLVKLLRLPFLDPSVNRFMREVFWATIANRENTNIKRNDLIDIIVKMKGQNYYADNYKFEGDTVVAQAGQFYAAGFETVSATMSFTLYELCFQPKIQNRLRSEIKSVLSKYGEVTYEALQDMKYLHMVICETLRKYPVLPFLDRLCQQDYTIPGTNFVIEKGTPVFIPMFGLHYDKKYFSNPEVYDPERFNEENKHKLPSYTYLPFGDGPRNCIDGDRLVAQAIIFFSAGHETTNSTIAFTLHELCLNQEIQDKLREEIVSTIKKHGELTYEAVQDMEYLHMVICESLRKYPLTPFIQRECVEDYEIPETGLIIEKGTPVVIPQHGLHWDEKYFPNPQYYDPERFSAENKSNITPFTYLPFGNGPRNCIGERFALLSSKLGIIYIISHFRVERNSDTQNPLTFCRSDLLQAKEGIRVTFTEI